MAGTNKKQSASQEIPTPPVIILVGPQLGENIGMCARAMLNCAVTEMRIVNPRDGWPNPSAVSAASGALSVIENAKTFTSTEEAIADLEFVLATTARGRDMVKDIYTAEEAAKEIRLKNTGDTPKCGILFGPERTGLENDDIALANAILNIPLNPGFSSLNLAQAVLLVCYAWLSAANPFEVGAVETEAPATKKDIDLLMQHLEDELTKAEFFRSPAQKPSILRNLKNYFFRSSPTEQEVRTLRGVIAALSGKRHQ